MEKEPQSISHDVRAANAAPEAAPETKKEDKTLNAKNRRSAGEKLFDVLLYPLITNVGVFGISVFATYLTNKGGMKNASGEYIHGKVGKWFFERGEHLKGFFKKNGLSEEQADMSKMVFFSFADGSALAPVIKLFEDRREGIARWLDKKMGTVPEDDSVYKDEPKQTWGSVIGARFLTALIVVSTATVLEKAGLNKILFHDPGVKLGNYLKTKPAITKAAGKWDVSELGKVSIFEAVYTSICTAGVYVVSRFLARKNKLETQDLASKNESVDLTVATEDTTTTPHSNFASEQLKKRKPNHEMPAASFAERAAETPQLAMQLG